MKRERKRRFKVTASYVMLPDPDDQPGGTRPHRVPRALSRAERAWLRRQTWQSVMRVVSVWLAGPSGAWGRCGYSRNNFNIAAEDAAPEIARTRKLALAALRSARRKST